MKRLFILTILILLMSSVTAFAAECDVVTLMYHNVTNNPEKVSDWCITADQLKEDIEYFSSRGYTIMTASEVANADIESLDGKKILLLTFDDGYEEWYTIVFPILKNMNVKATMFIVGGYVNRYGFLSDHQIREMSDSGIIEIGNHTRYLHSMPLSTIRNIYTSEDISDAVADIKGNAEYLKSITGKDVTSIAWPYGYNTPRLEQIVKTETPTIISFSTNYGVTRYSGNRYTVFNRINREASVSSEGIYLKAETATSDTLTYN